MANAKRCTGCLDFGIVPHNTLITLPLTNTVTGDHYIKFSMNGVSFSLKQNFVSTGQNFTIDTSLLNEDVEIVFEIIAPDGKTMSFSIDYDDDATPATSPLVKSTESFWKFYLKTEISMVDGATIGQSDTTYNVAFPSGIVETP